MKILFITLIGCLSILTIRANGQNNEVIINSYDEFEGLRIIESEPLAIHSKGYDGSSFVIFKIKMSEISNSTQFELTIRAKSKLSKDVKIDSPFGDSSKEILPYHFRNVDEVYLLIEESRHVISKDYFTISAEPDVYDTSIDIISRTKMKYEHEFKNEDLTFNLSKEFFEKLVNSEIVRLKVSDIEFSVNENDLYVGSEVFDIYLDNE